VDDVYGPEAVRVYLFAVSIDGPGHRCGYHAQGHDNNPVLFDAPAGLMSMQLAERSETFCSKQGII
jgi:hypothetical protein